MHIIPYSDKYHHSQNVCTHMLAYDNVKRIHYEINEKLRSDVEGFLSENRSNRFETSKIAKNQRINVHKCMQTNQQFGRMNVTQ